MESQPLSNRVAVVTGAGTRLGASIALALGEAGADVVVHCHRNLEDATEIARAISAAGRGAVVVQTDLTSAKGVEAVFRAADALGGCDLLINNAARFERR